MKSALMNFVAARIWRFLSIGAVITMLHPAAGHAQNVLVMEIVGEGTVSRTPDQATYAPGTKITLTAAPARGFRFAGWGPIGDPIVGDRAANPLALEMNSDLILIATFEVDEHALTVQLEGNGVSVSDIGSNRLILGPVGPTPSFGPMSIAYSLPQGARARMRILDITGRSVALLIDEMVGPGRHLVNWNGRTEAGTLSPGQYFVHFEALGKRVVRRITIVR